MQCSTGMCTPRLEMSSYCSPGKKQQAAVKEIITCLLNGQGNVPFVVSDSDVKKSQLQHSSER